MHNFVTEMYTYVYISVTKWCIVGHGTGALWNLWIRSNPINVRWHFYIGTAPSMWQLSFRKSLTVLQIDSSFYPLPWQHIGSGGQGLKRHLWVMAGNGQQNENDTRWIVTTAFMQMLNTWAPFQHKDSISMYGIPIIKIRQSWDHLIFIMGMHILKKSCVAKHTV